MKQSSNRTSYQSLTIYAVLASACLSVFATSLPTGGLQVQFRSDTGRCQGDTGVPQQGKPVSSWMTEDGVASPLTLRNEDYRPNWKANAFTRADGTQLPAVRFMRNPDNTDDVKSGDAYIPHMRLVAPADEAKTLNLGTESTWFIVMNYLCSQVNGSVFGFWDGNNRFGAFVLGETSGQNQLRFHNNVAVGAVTMTTGACLLDSRCDGSRAMCSRDGVTLLNNTVRPVARTSNSKFGIGSMVEGVQNTARFDCGELIVYNRALNDAEVRIVRNALAVRWGLPLVDPLWTGAAAGFCDDLAGIGSSTSTDTGRIAGSVLKSGNAGGLILSADSLSGDGYMLAAHDGGRLASTWDAERRCLRLRRTWRIESTFATTPACTVAFDLATIASGATGFSAKLYHRAVPTAAFVDTGVEGTLSQDGTNYAFAFAEGALSAGEYILVPTAMTTATAKPSEQDITVWFKSDVGVETYDETGAVTKWVNQGTLGAAADVLAYTGAVTVAENAVGVYPALNFDGASFLQSAAATDLARNPNESPTWFVVLNPTNDVAMRKDVGLFGLVSNNQRFGAFFPTANGGQRVQCYVGGNNLYMQAVVKNAWQVLDTTAQHQLGDAMWQDVGIDGRDVGLKVMDGKYEITSSILKIGHFREDAWGKPFPGQIAEIRVYNRALDPVERLLVERELAEKYGIVFDAPFINATHASDAVYTNGMTAAGYWSDGGFGRTAANGEGLLVEYPTWYDEAMRALWYAHDDGAFAWQTTQEGTLLARSWFFRAANSFSTLRLTFLLDELEDGSDYALYSRLADTDPWTRMPYPVEVVSGSASVLVPSGLQTGYYTLGKVTTESAFTRPCAGVEDGLVGWYRADTGVETANGAVAVWRNLGLVGGVGDVFAKQGSATCATDGFANGAESVRFDGTAYLESAQKTKWLATGDVTWFAVFKLAADVTPASRDGKGIFGNAGDGYALPYPDRFGMFFSGNEGKPLRTHGFVDNAANQFCTIPGGNILSNTTYLVDLRRYGKVLTTMLNGEFMEGHSNAFKSAFSDKFDIGKFLNVAPFKGDVAEIRIYNRALSDVERRIVDNQLAARYGVALTGGDVKFGNGIRNGCVHDVVGIGCGTRNDCTGTHDVNAANWVVRCKGTIATSDDSAGLTLAAVGAQANGDYLFAGHGEKANVWVKTSSSLKRMKRAWYLERTNMANVDITLSFDLESAALAAIPAKERPAYHLLKSTDGTAWTVVDVEPIATARGFSFTIPSTDYENGFYTLGAEVTPVGLVVIVR